MIEGRDREICMIVGAGEGPGRSLAVTFARRRRPLWIDHLVATGTILRPAPVSASTMHFAI
jgi:hypothetical protein